MNVVLGHPCVHIGKTGPGESPEDGEMNEMTLSSRHVFQTQDLKFEPWRSEAEHATFRSRRLRTILNHYE